ncbi:hypothetical protein D3C87_1449930 [compost metagenome]
MALRRFGHPVQVVHDVGCGLVIFLRAQLARGDLLEAGELVHFLAVFFHFGELGRALALQFPQHVRHADSREDEVVPARGARVVTVEGTQVGVEPVVAAGAGDDRQVRRHGAEERLGVLRRHRDRHRLAHLLGREEQVLTDLVVRQCQVLEPVVAHHRRTVAVQAVVDEQLGTALQRRYVAGVERRRLQGVAPLGSHRGHGREARADQCEDRKQLFHLVSLSSFGGRAALSADGT